MSKALEVTIKQSVPVLPVRLKAKEQSLPLRQSKNYEHESYLGAKRIKR